MKLKVKKLELTAGRPVALLNENTARSLNIHIGDRIEIFHSGKKIVAIVDIVKNFQSKDEISLSQEVISFLKLKTSSEVEITPALLPESTYFIIKKLKGHVLTKEEIYSIIRDIVTNSLSEAEIAYFISGVYEHGMNAKETIFLTEAMYKTGVMLSWHTENIADKHSIGGIPGNRTTPIIVSICSAAGIIMPKTSSRAITSAAGTADVVETIANVELSPEELQRIVKKTGACLAWGGSLGLAPADDKLIRVERLLNIDPESQLISSIMSKKLATGSKHILLDIPYGRGAKVSHKSALKLKDKFLALASHFNLDLNIILTDGSQPIGNGIGPVLEMLDVLAVLKRKNSPKDLENKAIKLSSVLLEKMKKAEKGKGEEKAMKILNSGAAFKKFNEIINAQGRKNTILKPAKFKHNILAHKQGKIIEINNKIINATSRILGCPNDKRAGIYLHKHKNETISENNALATLYAESPRKLNEALRFLNKNHPFKIR